MPDIHFFVDDASFNDIKSLSEIESHREIMEEALILYRWALQSAKDGNVLLCLNPKDNQAEQILLSSQMKRLNTEKINETPATPSSLTTKLRLVVSNT